MTLEDLVQIVDIQLRHLRELLDERGLTLRVSPVARRYLAERGFDPVYGARPLKRVIQRELQDSLALSLLQGDFVEGDMMQVDLQDGVLTFNRLEALVPAA